MQESENTFWKVLNYFRRLPDRGQRIRKRTGINRRILFFEERKAGKLNRMFLENY